MAVSASQQITYFERAKLGIEDEAGRLFRTAEAGDRDACSKVVYGVDYLVTASLSAVDEADNLDIPRTAFGLDVTGRTVALTIRTWQYGATAASLSASLTVSIVKNVSGTCVVPASAGSATMAAIGAAGQTGAVVSISGTNIRIALDPGSAVAQSAYVEIEARVLE